MLLLKRTNHVPCMTKTLRKSIMKRFELKSKYFKNQCMILNCIKNRKTSVANCLKKERNITIILM